MAATTGDDRLVIGIHFGTTFSGVAAVYSGAPEAPDEINVIKTWPGGNNITSDKVPSEIAYGPAPTSRAAAAASTSAGRYTADRFNLGQLRCSLTDSAVDQGDIVRFGFQLQPEEERLRCMKVLLDPKQELPSYVDRQSLEAQLHHAGKDAVEAVSDYLSSVWKHTLQTLERRYGKTFMQGTKLDVVLTVLAVWSDAAKDATLRAAHQAGMGVNLSLISEPEAAAVYTLQSIQPNHLRVGNNFIVCDAGGGTVDLISYEIKQVSPLRIEESAEGTGGMCGGAVLNLAFEKLVRGKIGAATFDRLRASKPRSWQTALKCFEEHVKRNFDPEAEDYSEFNIPFPLNDGEAPGVDQGFLTLFSHEVRSIFNPVMDEIAELIEAQMSRLDSRRKSVNGVVLVGGFGQSSCLFKTLESRFSNRITSRPCRGNPSAQSWSEDRFEIMQPANAWSAVVQGAVLRGLEGTELVLSRRSRRHYGVAASTTFDSKKHSQDLKWWDEHEEEYKARDQMQWYIHKGQTCSSKKVIQLPFYFTSTPRASKMHSSSVIVCDQAKAPSTLERGIRSATRVLCTLDVDLTPVPRRHWKQHSNASGVRYQSLHYTLGMQVESGGLRFDLRVDDVVYGNVVAKFN